MKLITEKEKAPSLFVSLTALCTLAYFVSYISRINLGASMVELVAIGYAPQTTVALALSINSIMYGAGQIISGYLGDRCRPQNVMLGGFILAGLMNVSVALLQDASWLIALWAVNGFAQSLMWPPIVRILAQNLNNDEYTVACKWVSWGSAFGTMAVYAVSPMLIGLVGCRSIFMVSGAAALVMAVVWKGAYEHLGVKTYSQVEPKAKTPDTAVGSGFTKTAVILMGLVMLAIVLQGMLRDGVTNWMPTLVSESFGLDSSSAILSGVMIPVFHILCSQVTTWLYRRVIRNELLCSGVIFAVAMLAAVGLVVFDGAGPVLSVSLMALLVGCMHGVNFVLICMVPPYFAGYGRVSLVSGILNSCTYVGSALSTYGIAVFSQLFGWQATIGLWAIIAALGMGICVALTRKWQRFANH